MKFVKRSVGRWGNCFLKEEKVAPPSCIVLGEQTHPRLKGHVVCSLYVFPRPPSSPLIPRPLLACERCGAVVLEGAVETCIDEEVHA